MKPKKNAFKTISPLYMPLDMGYMLNLGVTPVLSMAHRYLVQGVDSKLCWLVSTHI